MNSDLPNKSVSFFYFGNLHYIRSVRNRTQQLEHTMEYIYRTSTLFDGCKNIIYFADNKYNRHTGKYLRSNKRKIVRCLQEQGLYGFRIEMLKHNIFGRRSIRRLILRNNPAITAQQLEEEVKKYRTREKSASHWCLLCITDIKQNPEDATAQILVCRQIDDNKPQESVNRFLEELIKAYHANCATYHGSFVESRIRFSLPDPSRRYYFTSEEEELENMELLATELLAESIHPRKEVELSPIVFDAQFNIYLPLYPQISIELQPFIKAIYILFLRHPEGIFQKDFSTYSDELKQIYQNISGRMNYSIVNRLIRKISNPTDNTLNKCISSIRKEFLSKLRIDIAVHYIPSRGNYRVRKIPIDRKLVKFEKEK